MALTFPAVASDEIQWFAIGYKPLVDDAIMKCVKRPPLPPLPTTMPARTQGVPSREVTSGDNSLEIVGGKGLGAGGLNIRPIGNGTEKCGPNEVRGDGVGF